MKDISKSCIALHNSIMILSLSKEPATGSAAPSAAMTALKEELSRKSKLLVAIKAARAADVNALEQWKGESKKLEENCKRFVISAH